MHGQLVAAATLMGTHMTVSNATATMGMRRQLAGTAAMVMDMGIRGAKPPLPPLLHQRSVDERISCVCR